MTWARLHALINQETGSALLYFWIPKATEEDLTVCNGGGMVFQHTRLTCQIHVQSPTLCQTWCNKKQMHAWCFRHLQACPQCRAPWAVSFKPPCGQQKQPRCQKRAWVVAGKVHGCEPVLTNFVPPPSSASSGKCPPPRIGCDAHPRMGQVPGDRGGSPPSAGLCVGRTELRVSGWQRWGGNPEPLLSPGFQT